MSPGELIKTVGNLGIEMSRRNLNNWERLGLVSAPERGGHGQGKGRWTDYPDCAIAEVVTVHTIIEKHRLTLAEIAEAKSNYTKHLGSQADISFAGSLWGLYYNTLISGEQVDELVSQLQRGFTQVSLKLLKTLEGYK